MSGENRDVSLVLKVMVNKERSKVLYAVADNHFVDILLSFLTLPLGRIVKVLEKQYGDRSPSIGSLTNLYRSLADLDASHFVTEGAKDTLLNVISSFETHYQRLKLDIHSDNHSSDNASSSRHYGAWTIHRARFTISDDLQIFPNEIGLLRILTILGITDAHNAEEIEVALGFDEIVKLLKASMASHTPLSDVIFPKKTRQVVKHSAMMEVTDQPMIEAEENHSANNISLLVMIEESSGKCLYAQAKEDFINFLFSLLHIPLGGVEHLLGCKTSIVPINNLYTSTAELKDEYFKSLKTKNRLMKPKLPHGCISPTNILLLKRKRKRKRDPQVSSSKFPKGWGTYLEGPQTYMVTDDLTVIPFCAVSVLSTLNNLKIPISDVKEVELQIGFKEGLSILKASLSSTSVLTDALLNHIPNKQVKREV